MFAPSLNAPGTGGFDGNTIMYVCCIGFGVFLIWLGVHKPKEKKKRVRKASEPDWDSMEFDDDTPVTEAEADEIYKYATEEEIHEEFDLINATDEGPAFWRKVLAIVKWRRARAAPHFRT